MMLNQGFQLFACREIGILLKATINPSGWIKGKSGQNLIGFYVVLRCWPCALIFFFLIYGYRSEFPMILVGNKSDLEQERTVS